MVSEKQSSVLEQILSARGKLAPASISTALEKEPSCIAFIVHKTKLFAPALALA